MQVVKSSEGRGESLLRNEHRRSDGRGEGESLLRNEHAGSRRPELLQLMSFLIVRSLVVSTDQTPRTAFLAA